MTTGKIFKGIGGFYYVRDAEGAVYECKARGKFRKERIIPLIGDDVVIDADSGKGAIIEILPRRNSLVRPAVANTDMLVVVAAAADPDPSAAIIDKMLVNAEIRGIKPALCFNKCDLRYPEDLVEIYGKTGYKIALVCAQTGEGLDALADMIRGKTAAFTGISGVGKSSILKRLTNSELAVGAISEKTSRGRHTTRHVELFATDGGGYVFDTPGFSSIEPLETDAEDTAYLFPEMRDCIGKCRFRGCAHIGEPDCAVKAKVETGEIAPSRYASYKELYLLQKSRRFGKR